MENYPLLEWRPPLKPARQRHDGALLMGEYWMDTVQRVSGTQFTPGFREQWLVPYRVSVHPWDDMQ